MNCNVETGKQLGIAYRMNGGTWRMSDVIGPENELSK